MNILIIGAGSVGSALASQLIKDRHNVTIIDQDADAISEFCNLYDAYGLVGNGLDVTVLEKAGIEQADYLLAVTNNDELNILCCLAGKNLGVPQTGARVRNPEYKELLSVLQEEINWSFTINPELTVARELFHLLKYPFANTIETFFKGKAELAELALPQDSPLCGKPLKELRTSFTTPFLICAVLRDDHAIIPQGNFVLQPGDHISILIQDSKLTPFLKDVDLYKGTIHNLIIYGGGRVTYNLLQLLAKRDIHTTVIEEQPKTCQMLAEEFPFATIVCDDGTKQERLLEEGIDKTDAFLALSSVDEENAITSMYAKSFHVPKVVTMISASTYEDFYHNIGLESIVSPKSSMVDFIVRQVRANEQSRDASISSYYRMMDGRVNAIEYLVNNPIEGFTNIPLKDIKLNQGVLIACIERDGAIMIPSGTDEILPKDRLLIITAKDCHTILELLA